VPAGSASRIVQKALRQQGRLADRQTAGALVQGLAARNLLESQEGALGELLAVSTHGHAILGSLYQYSDQAKELY
jgi:hypothetical protein